MNNKESDSVLVWSDEHGDMRKKNKSSGTESPVDNSKQTIHIRILTSGKGRTVIELTNLPPNKKWCKDLVKMIKKKLGVGGAYKSDFIEIHTKDLPMVTSILELQNLKWKKIGG